jgi:hypothetical protein
VLGIEFVSERKRKRKGGARGKRQGKRRGRGRGRQRCEVGGGEVRVKWEEREHHDPTSKRYGKRHFQNWIYHFATLKFTPTFAFAFAFTFTFTSTFTVQILQCKRPCRPHHIHLIHFDP